MRTRISFIHSRVARRIFVLFIICALLPVCLLALVSLQKVSARLAEDSHKRLGQVGMITGMTVQEGLSLLQTELEAMPLPPGEVSRRSSPQTARSAEDRRFRAVTFVKEVSEGRTITGMPRRLSPAEHDHLADGKALIFSAGNPAEMGPMYMATATNPNLPRGGLLIGEINPDYLWSLVGTSLSTGIDICILGPSGKTLYASRPLSPALVSRVMSDQKGSISGQFEWQLEDEDYLVNHRSVFMKPSFLADSWTAVAFQSGQDSRGPARSFIRMFFLVVLLTLFVVVFASSILIRRSLVPLSILKEGARRLSRGNFDSRVEIASGDEFEDLAASFNDMSAQLEKQFIKLSDTGRLVQSILEANNRDTITDALLSRFRNAVSCEWLGITLVDGNSAFQAVTAYNNSSNGVSETVRVEARLGEEDLESLRAAGESLHVRAGQGFIALLAPMTAEGTAEFFLLPIFIKERLLGILILGYRSAPELVREDLARSRQVADEIAVSLDNVRLIDELGAMNRGTIEVLANAVDAKSPWTAGHSHRVTWLSLEIGKEMGLSRSDLELLQLSGLFHDIGKIGIPEYILDKPSSLTEEEYALVKNHPQKGAEMLRPIRAYHGAIPLVAQHHERFNGKGYPCGLAGEEIVLGARILAVADVFDALYSRRPYRQGWEIGKVISYLEDNAGDKFDPEVVKAFLKIDRTSYIESHADAGRPAPG